MRIARKTLAVVGAVALTVALSPSTGHAAATATPSVVGDFFALAPVRVLDTRVGNGATQQPLHANSTLHLQVTGRGGVPATGVSAVVLNVTVTGPTSASFLTVYPTGIARPSASNLNVTPGWVGANSVTVKIGDQGQVDIYNQAGNVDVIADVTGFYAADETPAATGTGGQYFVNNPWRALDTRTDDGGGPLANADWVDFSFGYQDATINPHLRAMAVNVTAVNATASGFLTLWNGNGDIPNASTLNYTKGAIVPNMAIIPVRPCDDTWCGTNAVMRVQNTGGGTVDVVVDVLGFYDDGQVGNGDTFHPLSVPTRITDTRIGLGISSALTTGSTRTQGLDTPIINPATADAVMANVTGISPTGPTFLTFWPPFTNTTKPNVSTLNLKAGDIRPNSAIIAIDHNNTFDVFNQNGTVNLAIDVSGTFDYTPTTAAGLTKKAPSTMTDTGTAHTS